MADEGHTETSPIKPQYSSPAGHQHYGAPNPGGPYQGAQSPYSAGYDQPQLHQPASQPYSTVAPNYHGRTARYAMPNSNMVIAVLSCLFCFWPVGLVAIIQAYQAENAITRGDIEDARNKSKSALHLSYASIGIGFALVLLCVILFAVVRVQGRSLYVN